MVHMLTTSEAQHLTKNRLLVRCPEGARERIRHHRKIGLKAVFRPCRDIVAMCQHGFATNDKNGYLVRLEIRASLLKPDRAKSLVAMALPEHPRPEQHHSANRCWGTKILVVIPAHNRKIAHDNGVTFF